MTLNLVKAQRGPKEKRECGKIGKKWITLRSHFFSCKRALFQASNLSITKTPFRESDVKLPCARVTEIWSKKKKKQRAYTRVLLYKSVTTNLTTKHPQGKVELCHQFPLKNSPPALGKNEGSASSVLSYLSCAHIRKKKKGGLSFWTTTSQKQEWKTWGEGRGMWCDALSNSCIHSVFLRKRGRGKKREKSGALSQWANFFGFQNASLLRPTNPLRPSMLRVPHKERCADTSARVHTIALANPNIFSLANALSPLARNHTCACSRTHYSEGLHK